MPVLTRLWQFLTQHPALAALALGVLAASGFQPLALWPLTLASIGLFTALLAQTTGPGRAAWLGWLFGMGYFTFGNSWIAAAFAYQANMPAVLGWFAVPLLSLYLAIFPALAALGARAVAGARLGWPIALALGGCWIASEWLRATLFTGYAWNPLSAALLGPLDRPGLAALLPWFGTYVLSGFAVAASVALAIFLRDKRWRSLAAAAAVLVAGMYWPAGPGRQGTLALTLVQPNIAQEHVNDPAYQRINFERLAVLSNHHQPGERRLVLWPESGMPDYLRPGYPQRYYDRTTMGGSPAVARQIIAGIIGQGSLLLTGALDLEIADGRMAGVRNAITALGDDGTIRGGYYKAHLVPYGEYLPMREWLEPIGLSRLVPGAVDFWPGPGPRTLDLGSYGKAGMQICYEIVFSGQVVDPEMRPDYIFNPSNDGWFGGFGPPQHLAQARMRAIEEGLPVLRSTTNGISGVVDARGVVRDYLPRGVSGTIEGFVPPAIAPTLFSRAGNWLALVWAVLLVAGAFVPMRKRPA